MPDDNSQAYVKKFEEELRDNMVAEQKESLLYPYVVKGPMTGEAMYVRYMDGNRSMKLKDTEHKRLEPVETGFNWRRLTSERYYDELWFTSQQELKAQLQFSGPLARASMRAAFRKLDDICIAALLGTAYEGKDTPTAVTLSTSAATHPTTAGLTGGNAITYAISWDNLLKTNAILNGKSKGGNIRSKTWVTGPAAFLEQVFKSASSMPFWGWGPNAHNAQLVLNGQIAEVGGFMFMAVESDRLNAVATASNTSNYAVVWKEDALEARVGVEPTVTYREPDNYVDSRLVLTVLDMGATRLNEFGVLRWTGTIASS